MNIPPVPILFGCVLKDMPEWRDQIQSLIGFPDVQLGIFLQEVPLEQRKNFYTTLEASSIKNIPFVQLASDSQVWEIQYLVEKFSTSVFSLPAHASSLPVIDSWPEVEAVCVVENSSDEVKESIFNQDIFSHSRIKGICLDLGFLENKRIQKNEDYTKDILVLDHQSISCVTVSPLAVSWWEKLSFKPNHLTSLAQLRYLAHFPRHYFGSMVILKLNNSFEEQNEVRLYLNSILNPEI